MFYLCDVSAHGEPAFYLALVFFRNSTAHVVAAIPLKPPARVVFVNPSFPLPHGEWLRGIHLKVIKRLVGDVIHREI